MSKKIVFTEDELGVISHSEGTVDRLETIKAIKHITEDARFPKLRYWIVDMTNADTYTTTFEDNKDISNLIIEKSRRNPRLLMVFLLLQTTYMLYLEFLKHSVVIVLSKSSISRQKGR